MPSPKTKKSQGSAGSKGSSSTSNTGAKKNSSKKSSSSSKKKTSSSKKESRSQEGFKKTKIPVKVMNTPEVEGDRELHPVPETISRSQESSNGIKPPKKENAEDVDRKEVEQQEEPEEERGGDKISDEEFFSDISEESSEASEEPFSDTGKDDGDKKAKKKDKKPKRSLSFNLYRKIAFTFVILTVFLLGGVAYFSLPSLEISIDPKKEVVNNSIPVNIYSQDNNESSQISQPSLSGVVDKVEIKESKKFQSTGARTIGKEIEGKVRIINNYTQDQTLVRTTRLLSPGGKLYRIDKKVVVPAGGSVEVEVYTEEPSPEMAIDSTKFTIPGLWAGLQDDIYAKSEESFEYRVKIKRYVQQSDIDKALEEIRDSLEKKAKSELGDSYQGKDRVIYQINEDSVKTTVDAEAGEEKDEFEIAIKGNVNIVALDNKKMIDLASRNLSTLTSNNSSMAEVDRESFSFDWTDFDYDKGTAIINASFSGEVVPSPDTELINKKEIVELNKEQLVSYLEEKDNIKDYKIDFFPSFMQKVPNLSDRIEVNIQAQ